MSVILEPIHSITAKLRAKSISCKELIEEHLKLIKKTNQSLKALRYVNESDATTKAKKIDHKISSGDLLGRIPGIFFSAKDHIPISGMTRSEGNEVTLEKSSSHTASSIERLFNEDAICIGKGNMAEYGKSYFTENTFFGRTCNPFNQEFSPGGSSGGDSAAVAAGFSSFGVVADAGGSVRVPANFCGLFGVFPTLGLISEHGQSSSTNAIMQLLRGNGFICRHIQDCELLFNILANFDYSDPRSIQSPFIEPTRTKKFGYYTSLNGVSCDNEIRSSLLSSVDRFKQLGYVAEEINPKIFEGSYEIFIILAGQAALQLEDLVAMQKGTPRDLTKEGPLLQNLRSRIKSELPALSVDMLLTCWNKIYALRSQTSDLFSKYDFIISPVAATTPIKHGTTKYSINGQEYLSQQVFQFANTVNTLGLPAIAFPTELSSKSLPLGLQIIGPRFSDLFLIKSLKDAGFENSLRSPII